MNDLGIDSHVGQSQGILGMVSGPFFGFAFGMGGVGAAVLGHVAGHRGIDKAPCPGFASR